MPGWADYCCLFFSLWDDEAKFISFSVILSTPRIDASRRAYIGRPELGWSFRGLWTAAAILLEFVANKWKNLIKIFLIVHPFEK